MSERAPHYWFAAKRYGWGWGLPSAWQGWVVLLGYLSLLFGGALFLRSSANFALSFSSLTAVLTLTLLAICVAKGEPVRWRWGRSSR